MMYIIANPTAGGGSAEAVVETVQRVLRERNIDFECLRTSREGDAERFARETAAQPNEGLVCVGGDGTIFEIVNGLAGRPASLYFVSCGTGNDFVRALNFPKDPIAAFIAQLDGDAAPIDVGRVNNLYFANVSGCGFDVEVLRQTERFKRWGRGLLPYLLGVAAALRRFKPLEVELTMDGKTEKRAVTIISVGNGQFFGGGMKAVPHADPADGLFDVIVVERVGRFTIARLLSRFISGGHTSLSFVHESRCASLTIRSRGMTVNLDGELRNMDVADYRLIPGAITIHRPHVTPYQRPSI